MPDHWARASGTVSRVLPSLARAGSGFVPAPFLRSKHLPSQATALALRGVSARLRAYPSWGSLSTRRARVARALPSFFTKSVTGVAWHRATAPGVLVDLSEAVIHGRSPGPVLEQGLSCRASGPSTCSYFLWQVGSWRALARARSPPATELLPYLDGNSFLWSRHVQNSQDNLLQTGRPAVHGPGSLHLLLAMPQATRG